MTGHTHTQTWKRFHKRRVTFTMCAAIWPFLCSFHSFYMLGNDPYIWFHDPLLGLNLQKGPRSIGNQRVLPQLLFESYEADGSCHLAPILCYRSTFLPVPVPTLQSTCHVTENMLTTSCPREGSGGPGHPGNGCCLLGILQLSRHDPVPFKVCALVDD